MARQSKIGDLTKLRHNNKNTFQVLNERNSGKAPLLNFKNGNRVEIQWGMNEATVADQIFILKIDDKEAWLSSEDIQRFLRWV